MCRVTLNIGVKTRHNKNWSTWKVLIEIGSKQGRSLAIHWLLEEFQKCLSRNMAFKLSSELVDVAKGLGYHAKKESDSQNSRSRCCQRVGVPC
jgi:small subunit ribosomal protein S7